MKTVNEKYDVVVCGGGLAGVSAAIAAARHGAKTCLVQDRPVLGGNSSSEIRVTPHGAAAFHAYARESGIVSEALIQERLTNHETITENGWTNSVWDLTLYDLAVQTANLTLHLNSSVDEVNASDRQIDSIAVRTHNAEVYRVIEAEVFIDCTGDGTVGALAGCRWMQGTEAHSEYGEPHAPQEQTDDVMGSSVHFKTVDMGHPVPFEAPDWAVNYDDPKFFYEGGRVPKTLRSGYWWIEIGPPWDTIHDNQELQHELTRHVLGIWDYIKNKDPELRKQAQNLALDWVGQVPGKRESRRLIGDYILNENELIERKVFEDEVAFGGWYVDLHTLGGLLADTSEPLNARELDPTSTYGVETNVGPFGIPLGILIAADMDNLMMAGRNASATHAAMGSIRVMGTCAVMGQAAGTAAAIATAHSIPIRQVRSERIKELQQDLLRDGCFLPNERNTDPLDLARSATISASGSQMLSGTGPASPGRLSGIGQWTDHPVYPRRGVLERRLGQWIALGEGPEISTVSLCLSNNSETATVAHAQIYLVDGIWDYRVEPGVPLAEVDLEVSPGGPQWVEWDLEGKIASDKLPSGGYVRIDVDANPDLEWHVAGEMLPGNLAAYEAMPGRYRRFGGGETLSFKITPAQNCYRPENVVSGVTRPSKATNMWRSDPNEPLPHWLELSWAHPQSIRQIQLTFEGNLLREYHAYPPFYRDPQTVADYEIQVEDSGQWRTVIKVEGNAASRVVHTLDEAVVSDKIRLVVQSTNGDPAAGLFEIRVYDDLECTPTPFSPGNDA